MFILEQYLDHYSFSFPFKIAFMLSYLCIAHILTGYNLHDSMFETWNIYTHTHTYVVQVKYILCMVLLRHKI